MPEKQPKNPSYRHHKPSGQAVVGLNGRDIYLGAHNTKASRAQYDRVIAEWLANGRQRPVPARELTVNELIVAYWRHAQTYYRKNGRTTGELWKIKSAMGPLRRLYGRSTIDAVRPLALKAVREELVKTGMCRKSVNERVGRIKRMFSWGVENELVPPSITHGLREVRGLKRGRTAAPDRPRIKPVPEPFVEAVIPHVSLQVAAMIRVQMFTGMRPGEVAIMRTGDLDVSGRVWVYRPGSHKTEHHGLTREVLIGPQGQAVLKPWLRTELDHYIFAPAEAEVDRNSRRRAARASPMTPSQRRRRRRRSPRRAAGDRYDANSYRRAITRGCDMADRTARREARQPECKTCDARGWVEDESTAKRKPCEACSGSGYVGERLIPAWAPNRLRHNFATRIRREHGLETTRILLGHQSAITSEIYAEANQLAAKAIMVQAG